MQEHSLIKHFFTNSKAKIGALLFLVYLLVAVLAPVITSHAPEKRVARPHQAPTTEHVMGTTRLGRDVYTQFVWGTQLSLGVGLFAGLLVTVIGTVVGVVAGYYGGRIDHVLNFITNVVIVIPSLPLLLVLAAFIGQASPLVIGLIIGLTSWTWGARVMRAQTMTIRRRDFILAAEIMGESKWRIMLIEILPNLLSIISINFVGSVIYAILAEATLEFLGLGDPTVTSWGVMLYNAQNASALYVGAWWEVFFPCIAIAGLSVSLILLNMGMDEIANPRLRTSGDWDETLAKHKKGELPIHEG